MAEGRVEPDPEGMVNPEGTCTSQAYGSVHSPCEHLTLARTLTLTLTLSGTDFSVT